MKPDYLFVYGTLKKSCRHNMRFYLTRYAKYLEDGIFCGKMYQLNGYPGVVPSDSPDDKVFGEVYILKNPSSLFQKLDRYEGFGSGFRIPYEFIRRKQTVKLSSGDTIQAWIYLYNRPIRGLRLLDSGVY